MKNYYNGKCVLITGAGGALGSLMSNALLQAGATVLAVDITEGALAQLKDENLYFLDAISRRPRRLPGSKKL